VNGGLVQGVEPSSSSRNRGRRRSQGQNRRRQGWVAQWQLPPRSKPEARMGATAAHEGRAVALLAARRALVPRLGVSLANAKWHLSMEDAPGCRSPHPSHGAERSSLGRSRSGGPTRRRGAKAHRKPQREMRHGCRRLALSVARGTRRPARCLSPNKVDAAHLRGDRVDVTTPSPGHAAGPKTCCSGRGESLGDAPGTNEYGCS